MSTGEPAERLDLALSFLKALADQTRLRLVGLLACEERRTVEELADLLGVKAPTVSHHLAVLKRVGLVTMTPDGTIHYYSLDKDAFARLGREILSAEAVASLGPRARLDAWADKVLRAFVDGERITALPVKWKKRQVILEWLAAKFEMGVRYPEAKVNEVIKAHHEDYATLRREMVDGGLMRRERGVYWRPEAKPEDA